MSYSEFPHTNYSDTDFAELIALYKEVQAKYNGTLNTITALEKRLDEYESNMTTRVRQYADSIIVPRLEAISTMVTETLTNGLTEINNNVAAYKTALDAKLKDYQNTLDLRIAEFEGNILKSVSGYFDVNRKEYEAAVKALKKQMSSFKKEIHNEITSIKENIEIKPDTAAWFWDNILNSGGMSAYEWYKASNITCEDWNNTQITCIDWYSRAKVVLNWYVNLLMLFSPVSGEYVTVQEALIELANKLKINSITAGEYDSMNLTADEFDRLIKNIGEYDWQGGLLTYMFDSRTERGD